MKQFSMMLRLSIILICVMAIPLAILTWYSGTQILRNSEEAIAESAFAGLNANRMLNETALGHLSQNTARLASTGLFDRLRPLDSYAKLNASYGNVTQASDVLDELLTLNQSIDGVYSSFFYLTGADYIISTDKGITLLDNYETIDWLDSEVQKQIGISGKWYPRKHASGINLFSFVLPLNQLLSTTRGTIVINLNESQIEQNLHSTTSGNQNYLLMDDNGMVLSHADKSLFLTRTEDAFARNIVQQRTSQGYAIQEVGDRRLLYAWSRSKSLNWVHLSTFSMDELMNKTFNVQKNIVWLTLIIILVGSILSVVLATWLYKPIRKLVRTVRERVNWGEADENELAFLEEAFKRMQTEEEELKNLLNEREHGVREFAIRNLLRGEMSAPVEKIFTESYFFVVVVSIDSFRDYIWKNNSETRKYHRYALITQYDKLFPYDAITRCVYHGEGHYVLVVNHELGLCANNGKIIAAILSVIKDKAVETLGHSVTLGVSSRTDDIRTVSDRFTEAMEAIKRRMVAGSGCILHWSEEMTGGKKYMYPAHSERKILNYIDKGALEPIKEELAHIREEIRLADHISIDNILFIYNQLAGATIKHLRENNVNTTKIFMKRGSIYTALAACDTQDEIEECLLSFYSEIVPYFASDAKESNSYGDRIVQHLNEHYTKEIVFEDMAKDIGISYSYMRKLSYEMTGLSLVDYLNMLRIEKAKELLTDSQLTIAQIASDVGYFNVRSLNHYFRKFEGMTPSSYKALKSK